MTHLQESLFGIPVSTHRDRDVEHSPFPYELVIAAIAIAFFRTTVKIQSKKEPVSLRWFFGLMLAFLAYTNKSYELIISVEIFSLAVPMLLYSDFPTYLMDGKDSKVLRLVLIAVSAIMSLSICHFAASGDLVQLLGILTPPFVSDALSSLLPTREVRAAYAVLDRFILEPGLLQYQVSRLFFITSHIQFGIGYLGIDFLKQEQQRRNELVRMDLTSKDDDEDDDDDNDNDNNELTKKKKKMGSTNGKNDSKEEPTKTESKLMKKSKRFQRGAFPFILYAAVPYMIKIIGFGNLNAFAYTCFKDDVHRAVRLYDLFDHDNYLVAMSEHSATAPEAYAGYMDTIVSTTYNLFNRKLFSLPKVMLLPVIMARQPKMMAQIFPIIFMADWVKGRAVVYMTSRIEQLEKETQELAAMRSKVESFDIKNAELLQRAGAGATDFTRKRWEELTVQVQMKTVVKDLTVRTKGFFAWIERNFVFSVLVDCALAHLIAVGKIVASDIFVFSRAIEDAVDMALMKSRSEAELARMMTQIDNMKELAEVWDNAKARNLVPCNVVPPSIMERRTDGHTSMVVLRNLLYSRGTCVVRVDHLELEAGIYALTGANGSGKSTLFRVLMSCNSNERSIDLPPSIVLSTPFKSLIEEDDIEREKSCEAADKETLDESEEVVESDARELSEPHPRLSITMPSSHVVEISQTFYWPLYSKPIDWIYQEHVSDTCAADVLDSRVRRVAEELHSLEFTQSLVNIDDGSSSGSEGATTAPSEDTINAIIDQLQEVKEDWFNDLSGGQRSKVELVRKVFLQEECPHVLLVDETMAPLDPRSKSLVMSKLKEFCSGSVIIVIYHTDVGREQEGEEGQSVECVPSNDFFDGNIHVENQMMHLRPVC